VTNAIAFLMCSILVGSTYLTSKAAKIYNYDLSNKTAIKESDLSISTRMGVH